MSNILCCPKCGQKTVQIINHEYMRLNDFEYPFPKKLFGKFQCLQMHCHEIFNAVLNVKFEQEEHPQEVLNDINKAIEYLKSKGFYTDNLWCIDDVKMHYDRSDEEAMKILDDVMTSDPVFETIFQQMHDASFTLNLKRHEDDYQI